MASACGVALRGPMFIYSPADRGHCRTRGLQGPPGTSRGLQGPPGTCRGLQGPAGPWRSLQGPAGGSEGHLVKLYTQFLFSSCSCFHTDSDQCVVDNSCVNIESAPAGGTWSMF